jgi:DNA-directed RNA polymerase specialized sigma24 family protein
VIAWETLDGVPSIEPIGSRNPPPFEERLAEGDALRTALDSLDPKDVACLRLSILEGFTAVEIAHILTITPEAARQRLSRATRRLREAYFVQADRYPPVKPVEAAILPADTSLKRRERDI